MQLSYISQLVGVVLDAARVTADVLGGKHAARARRLRTSRVDAVLRPVPRHHQVSKATPAGRNAELSRVGWGQHVPKRAREQRAARKKVDSQAHFHLPFESTPLVNS